MVAASEAIEIKKSIVEHATPVEHTFSIVFNLGNENDGLAVAASSSKILYLNTDNVRAVCESGSRRKRNVAPYCQLYKEESLVDEYEKTNTDEKPNAEESEKINENEAQNDDGSREISHEKEQKQDQMTLLNVTIYPHLSELNHCYIDLRDLALELHKFTKGGYGLSIRSKRQAEDIVLKIYILSNTERTNKANFKGQIVIKDGYKYADRISVHMYGENGFVKFMDIVLLKPSSLHVNRSFVTLFAGNLDFNCEINFQYSAENLKPYRLAKSLLLTNVLPLEKASTGQPITVVLIDYFAYQAKYNTFSLIFDDNSLSLTTLVKHTKDIQSLWVDINEAIEDSKKVAPLA
uniref:Uncharacterized protein n=1 Tax=Romanomermis culicivorax TaxID=13658 RepID=A0A915J0N5_ROMCU